MGTPSFHSLDAVAHLIPTRGHPLLVLFKRVSFDKSFQRGIRRVGSDAGENLRRRGGALVIFQVLAAGGESVSRREQKTKAANSAADRK